MSDRVIKSGSTPTLRGPIVETREREGTTSRYPYTGSYEEIAAKRQELLARGATNLTMQPAEGGLWELDATFAGAPEEQGGATSEPPTNLHEIEFVEQVDPFYDNKTLQSKFSGDALAEIVRVWNKYEKEAYSDDSGYIKSTDVLTAWADKTPIQRARLDLTRMMTRASLTSQISLATSFFNRLAAGGAGKSIRYESFYRRRITAASSSQVRAAYTGVMQIWTSAEVENFEGVPTAQWFGLPNTYWLKLPPRVTASAGGKTDIEYSYRGGMNNVTAFLYTAYGSATLLDP